MYQLKQRLQLWDERTILSIIARRGLSLNKFMKSVSMIGDGYVWGIFAIVFYLFTDVTNIWLQTGITAFAIELICYKIIKQLTTRLRPFHANIGILNLVEPQDEYSFPSGHTAAATVAALLFSAAVPLLFPFFCLLAFVIGLSRVYLGVHYPTDVLMGFVLGVFSFAVSYSIF